LGSFVVVPDMIVAVGDVPSKTMNLTSEKETLAVLVAKGIIHHCSSLLRSTGENSLEHIKKMMIYFQQLSQN